MTHGGMALKRIFTGKARAYIEAVIVNILWGLSFIGSKKALTDGFEPFSLALIRFSVASAALFVIARINHTNLRITLHQLPALFASGLTGISVYFACELNGLKYCSAATASLIIASIPVFNLLTGFLFHGRKPSWFAWIGALLSLAGVWLVGSSGNENDSPAGILLMLGACLCWVLYGEVTDYAMKKSSCLSVTFWQSVLSLPVLLPLSMTEHIHWAAVSVEAWLWAAVFLGLLCSAIGFILYNSAIEAINPEKTSIFLNISPIAGVLGSALLLEEKILARQIIGGILILLSIWMVTKPSRSLSESSQHNRQE